MSPVPHVLQFLVVAVAGWINQQPRDLVQSCSFSVTVLARLLGETGFLAFGDSITTGVFSPDLALALATSAGIPTSYPAQLEALLMGRYPDQPISVINSGKPGEDTRDGKQRLPGVLDQVRPDVVMILEGINGLSFVGPAQTAADIDSMVRWAFGGSRRPREALSSSSRAWCGRRDPGADDRLDSAPFSPAHSPHLPIAPAGA